MVQIQKAQKDVWGSASPPIPVCSSPSTPPNPHPPGPRGRHLITLPCLLGDASVHPKCMHHKDGRGLPIGLGDQGSCVPTASSFSLSQEIGPPNSVFSSNRLHVQ